MRYSPILFLLFALPLFGQGSFVSADLTGLSVTNISADTYEISANYNDVSGATDGNDVAIGGQVWTPGLNPGDTCRLMVITSVESSFAGFITVRVNAAGQGAPSTQNAYYMNADSNNVGIPTIAGGSQSLRECISRYYASKKSPQQLSLSGLELSLSGGGGSVTLPGGGVNDGNGIYSGSGTVSDNTTVTVDDSEVLFVADNAAVDITRLRMSPGSIGIEGQPSDGESFSLFKYENTNSGGFIFDADNFNFDGGGHSMDFTLRPTGSHYTTYRSFNDRTEAWWANGRVRFGLTSTPNPTTASGMANPTFTNNILEIYGTGNELKLFDSYFMPSTSPTDNQIIVWQDDGTASFQDYGQSSVNYADYFFVSQSNGDNSTAIQGDINSPWTDPWAAQSAAPSGSIIFVLDGDFRLDTIGGVDGNVFFDAEDQMSVSLMQKDMQYIFESGTRIGPAINSVALPIFYDTIGVNTKISGELTIDYREYAIFGLAWLGKRGQQKQALGIGGPTPTNLVVELDSLLVGNNDYWTTSMRVGDIESLSFSGNYMLLERTWFYRGVTLDTLSTTHTFTFDRADWKRTEITFNPGAMTTGSLLEINIGVLNATVESYALDNINMVGGTIVFNVGRLEMERFEPNVNDIFLRGSYTSSSRPFRDGTYLFNVGQCVSNGVSFTDGVSNRFSGNTNNKIIFRGNFFFDGAPIFSNTNDANINGEQLQYIFQNATIEVENSPAVVIQDSSAVFFSNSFVEVKTDTAAVVISQNGSNLNLVNSYLKVPNATVPISSDVSTNVYIDGTHSNSTLIDNDINYIVSNHYASDAVTDNDTSPTNEGILSLSNPQPNSIELRSNTQGALPIIFQGDANTTVTGSVESRTITFSAAGGGGGIISRYVRQASQPTDSTIVWAQPYGDPVPLDKIYIYGDNGYSHVGWRNTATGETSTQDPLFFLVSGQSNARDGHPSRFGGDLTTDNRVMVWDYLDGEGWVVADVAPNNGWGFQTAKKFASEENRLVYYVVVAESGRAISQWTGNGAMITAVKEVVDSTGVEAFDFILWSQGEANTSTDSLEYLSDYNEVLDTLYAQSWFSPDRPFIGSGMLTAANGGGADGKHEFYRSTATNNNPWTSWINTDSLSAAAFDSFHFEGTAVDTMGAYAYAAYYAMPYDLDRNRAYLSTTTTGGGGGGTTTETYTNLTNGFTLNISPEGNVLIQADLSTGVNKPINIQDANTPDGAYMDVVNYGEGTVTLDRISGSFLTSNGLSSTSVVSNESVRFIFDDTEDVWYEMYRPGPDLTTQPDTVIITLTGNFESVTTGNQPGFWRCPEQYNGYAIHSVQWNFLSPHTGGFILMQLTDGLVGYMGATIPDGVATQTEDESAAPRTLVTGELVRPLVSGGTRTTDPEGLVVNLMLIK